MKRSQLHRQALATLSAAALLLFLALPAAAIDIPEGDDTWNTPGNGGTTFTMPGADLDTICGIGGNVDTAIALKGKNLGGGQGNADIVIHRESDIDFDESATGEQTATTQVHVTDVHFVSKTSVPSTCGNLDFDVTLDGAQPSTTMAVTLDADGLGGDFDADIALNVAYQASSGGVDVGPPMPYSGTLLNPPGGTPWGYTPPPNPLNGNAPWFPGVTKAGDPVNIVRLYNNPIFQALHGYFLAGLVGGGCRSIEVVDGRTLISIRPCPIDDIEPIDIDPIGIEPIGTLLN